MKQKAWFLCSFDLNYLKEWEKKMTRKQGSISFWHAAMFLFWSTTEPICKRSPATSFLSGIPIWPHVVKYYHLATCWPLRWRWEITGEINHEQNILLDETRSLTIWSLEFLDLQDSSLKIRDVAFPLFTYSYMFMDIMFQFAERKVSERHAKLRLDFSNSISRQSSSWSRHDFPVTPGSDDTVLLSFTMVSVSD